MSDTLNTIVEMPLAKKAGMLGGGIMAVAVLFYLLVYSSLSEQYSKLDRDVNGPQGLKSSIAKEQGVAGNIVKFRAEVARLDIELDKALKELPDKKEVDLLLARISDKATAAGLDISSFKPQGERKREFYAEQPVEISVNGSYHQVASFFDEVGRLERIVNLDRFHVKEPVSSDEGISISTTVMATAFRFLEESERPQKADDKRKKKRSK